MIRCEKSQQERTARVGHNKLCFPAIDPPQLRDVSVRERRGMAAVDCETCAGRWESDVKNLQDSRVGAEQLLEAHQFA